MAIGQAEEEVMLLLAEQGRVPVNGGQSLSIRYCGWASKVTPSG